MYNYSKFANKEYDLVHPSGLKVGDKIPDFELMNLENERVSLSKYFNKPIILETGSITCGMFAGQSKEMNEIARQNQDFNFLLLYVREAHPGNKIPAHHSFEEKCSLATRLNKEDEIENRTVLIDDIDGTAHKQLGALPNMIFIIDTDGTITFKADWNNAKALNKTLIAYTQKSKTVVEQKWEMLPLPNIAVEYRIFKRAGWDAAFDFIVSLPRLIFSHLKGGLCAKYPKFC